MKKILFSLVALVASMSMNAQVMKVMKDGVEVAKYKGANYTVVFEEAPALEKTGTAKRTGDIDVNWVQLWEDGPRFAEYNVGAESASEYGGFYTWGGSIDKDNSDANMSGINLTGDKDTATKLWGNNWRMPTKAELEALKDNCTREWKTVNGMEGLLFTGKESYSSNSVFFPASGSVDIMDFHGEKQVNWNQKNQKGGYWASTPTYDWGTSLTFFNNGNINVDAKNPVYLSCVRAVLAE